MKACFFLFFAIIQHNYFLENSFTCQIHSRLRCLWGMKNIPVLYREWQLNLNVSLLVCLHICTRNSSRSRIQNMWHEKMDGQILQRKTNHFFHTFSQTLNTQTSSSLKYGPKWILKFYNWHDRLLETKLAKSSSHFKSTKPWKKDKPRSFTQWAVSTVEAQSRLADVKWQAVYWGKRKQWGALWPAIRVAAGAFKSLNEGLLCFISVPEHEWEQVGSTEGPEAGGPIHLQLNKQLETTCLPPASAVTNRRWMKIAM